MTNRAEELRKSILEQVHEYSTLCHAANRPASDPRGSVDFIPGETTIPYAGRVFDEEEVVNAAGSVLDFWLTLGKEGEAFESDLSDFLGVKKSLLVNSGSSANLLAISALTTHKMPDEKRILPGDEVITVAAGFPTTVAPVVQVGAVPVFVDAKPETGNADFSRLEEAYTPGKTKAVMMAHALGNPFELITVLEFCHRYDLWLIEDNCDALGCSYTLPLEKAREFGLKHLIRIAEKGEHPVIRLGEKDGIETLTALTGSFGDLSTQSFYPPHHLTLGEGGAVNIVRDMKLKIYVESFRDWGRDCWCASGIDNTCNKRFGWQLGELPMGYDHKYIYSHLGYNLKPLDLQAAIGRAQLKKLPGFVEARKQNWEVLRRGLRDLEEYFMFSLPTHATAWNPGSDEELSSRFEWDDTFCQTDCSWFGFKITTRKDAPFSRTELASYLDESKIGNRMLFGGNLLRQPAFVQLKRERPDSLRVCGEMTGADKIMNQTLFLGVYPGLTTEMLDYMVERIHEFVRSKV